MLTSSETETSRPNIKSKLCGKKTISSVAKIVIEEITVEVWITVSFKIDNEMVIQVKNATS